MKFDQRWLGVYLKKEGKCVAGAMPIEARKEKNQTSVEILFEKNNLRTKQISE